MGHWELIIHLCTVTQFHTRLPHKAKCYSWLSFDPMTIFAWYKSCLIHALSIETKGIYPSTSCPTFCAVEYSDNQRRKARSESLGLLVITSPVDQPLSQHSDPASLLQCPSSGALISLLNNTNYPALCYLVPMALSFLATLDTLQPEVSSQNAYLPMSHPCFQSKVFQWPVWSALPASPDISCPLSPHHLLTILQTKHSLPKTCLSVCPWCPLSTALLTEFDYPLTTKAFLMQSESHLSFLM